jgi:hypothetical protein
MLDKIGIGIITAPRALPTLSLSVKSLRDSIPGCYLNIFSEPGEIHLDGGAMNVLINRVKLGALKNYDNALNYIYSHSEKPYIWVTEDDYLYNSSLTDRLNEAVEYADEFGYFNMFTNSENSILREQTDEGWLRMDLGYSDAWGMSYLFRRETVKRLREDEYYLNTFSDHDRNIDAIVSESLNRMGLAMFYHNPSPSCSCGIISTLGHSCKTDGLNFKL